MNEKLHQCVGLVELLRDHLKDKHHTRLELMIIILIMIEVCIARVIYSCIQICKFAVVLFSFGASIMGVSGSPPRHKIKKYDNYNDNKKG